MSEPKDWDWGDAEKYLRSLLEDHPFAARDMFLRLMGFASYDAYLKSDLWASIVGRLSELKLAKECSRCGARYGLVWHHRRYTLDVLAGNFPVFDGEKLHNPNPYRSEDELKAINNPVVRICSNCHEFIHFASGKWIADLSRVDHRLRHGSDDSRYAEFDKFAEGGGESEFV
jgi:hypothetical protein